MIFVSGIRVGHDFLGPSILADPLEPISQTITSSPVYPSLDPRYHWHLDVRVRLPVGGGFEWGTGFFVNPIAPEEAARLLREAA